MIREKMEREGNSFNTKAFGKWFQQFFLSQEEKAFVYGMDKLPTFTVSSPPKSRKWNQKIGEIKKSIEVDFFFFFFIPSFFFDSQENTCSKKIVSLTIEVLQQTEYVTNAT